MVGIMVTLVKAGGVFALLALTVKLLRRYDRTRLGTSSRGRRGTPSRARRSAGAGHGRRGGLLSLGAAALGRGDAPRPVLDVVERAPLGRATSVVLVRVHDQHFLFGVTDTQVSMLLEVDLPDDTDGHVEGHLDERDGLPLDLRSDTADDGQTPEAVGTVSFRSELLRQARLRLPGHGTDRVELIDPPHLDPEGDR